MSMKKNYVSVELDKLTDYEHNNKVHTDEDIAEIVKSIQKTGYLSPIVVDENFEIINGHGRKEALKRLGMKTVEVLQVLGLSKEQKRKARLLDNKVGDLAEYDIDNLKLELEDLADDEISDLFEDLVGEPDEVDYSQIYQGMPEYNQQDLSAKYQFKVSFQTIEDLEEFGRVIGQNVTDKTRSIRYPAGAREDLAAEKYVNEE